MRLVNRTVSVQLGLLLEIIERERCSLMEAPLSVFAALRFKLRYPSRMDENNGQQGVRFFALGRA